MHVEAAERSIELSSPQGMTQVASQRSKRMVYAVLIAQLLSVALAVTGVSSARLTDQGIYAPTTQSFLNYCLLAVVFGAVHLVLPWLQSPAVVTAQADECTDSDSGVADSSGIPSDALTPTLGQQHSSRTGPCCSSGQLSPDKASPADGLSERLVRLRRLWPVFAAMAFIDVEANTLVTTAYQYTSLTSVTLLDCCTIPAVMILSWLVLRSRYKLGHFFGALCCIAGLSILVLGDSRTASPHDGLTDAGLHGVPGCSSGPSKSCVHGPSAIADSRSSNASKASSGSHMLLGDVLVLLGAVLYSVCNVTQELLLGDVQTSELLAYIGMFGAVISGIQAAATEYQVLLSANWSQLSVAGPMIAFAAAMFCFYTLVPQVLIMGGAAVLNISLLTSDMWAALARCLWFGGFEGLSAYFFLGSLAMVALGIVVYAASGSPKASGSTCGSLSEGRTRGHQGRSRVCSDRAQYTRVCSTEPAAEHDVERALA